MPGAARAEHRVVGDRTHHRGEHRLPVPVELAITEVQHAVTADGHGAFVQVSSCTSYTPAITQKLFKLFSDDILIQNTSYIPMTDTNQTQMLAFISGGAVQEGGCTLDCTTPPTEPGPVVTPEPDPEPDVCPITNGCPTGQQLVGAGKNCSCVVKNTCVGSVLDEATNSCVAPGAGCPSGYQTAGDLCGYMPKQIMVEVPCYFPTDKPPCKGIDWEPCKPPSELLASSGACIAPPNCPSGYTWSWNPRGCTKPNQ